GKDEEALEYYQKAIAIAAEIDNSQILWNTLCEMADLKKKKGDFDEALKCYEYAMNVIEKSRSSIGDEDLKALYLGSNRRLAAFHGAIDLLYKISRNGDASGAAARAFGYIERAKARGFMDSLEIGRVSAAQPVDPVTDNKMKALQIRLSRLSRQLGEPPPSYEESRVAEEEALRLEEEYEKFRRDLRLLDPRFAGVRFPDLITLEQLKSSLPDDGTVVLTYALGQESAYGLAIDRKGQRLFPLPAPRVLRELVVRHLKWVSDPERKPEETAVDLYRTLIAPGIKETCPRILIVPDDVLHYLPFETIRPPAGSHWLGAETEIAYAPSLSSLAEIEKRADQRRPPHLDFFAVAAADPEVAEDQGSFRYRSEEVDEISKLFRPGRCVLLKGEEAGEANLKRSPLSDARIIHFAAHGTIDEQKPVRSAIILGDEPGSDEDGRFQAREVYDLRLNAGLVVLSSCRSAAGKLLRGEGIIGLSRAFLFAGASAVLMSLWPVDEEATRHLMGRFYFHLKDGHTASASLRLAKTEMIDSTHFSHPYFWAGFVVAGAANRRLTPGFSSWRAATLGAAFLIGAAVFLAIRRNRKNKY
ncbi:MAG: CHAT domain-containing protein, partial [Candidatus Aminicenantes bacterium]|nr:CHAT domain-containing protein [Candidatus Aminicenantes bacterium]